mmetsp:Transcript_3286/g.4608  ORF Transcript_3286/g.4608 Transcript_3286/m.4608 type:complete len:229 (-) Transcript_3286:1749-2435(-)
MLALNILKTSKHQAILKEVRHKYTHKQNIYPNNPAEGFHLLNHDVTSNNIRKTSESTRKKKKKKSNNEDKDGLIEGAQYDQGNLTPGTNDTAYEGIACYVCDKQSHYSRMCPEKQKLLKKTSQNHQEGVNLNSNIRGSEDDSDYSDVEVEYYGIQAQQHFQETVGDTTVNETGIIIDTGSSVSVFDNKDYLTDIHQARVELRTISNGGHQDSYYPLYVSGLVQSQLTC